MTLHTSLLAIPLAGRARPEEPDDSMLDVSAVCAKAAAAGDLDRAQPIAGESAIACEVAWGGRAGRAAVRLLTDPTPRLRVEMVVVDPPPRALQRQAELVRMVLRHLPADVLPAADDRVLTDVSAHIDRPLQWVHQAAVGDVELDDCYSVHVQGAGQHWLYTHGLARFELPDLELYGVPADCIETGTTLLHAVVQQLVGGPGLKTELRDPATGVGLFLVPVLRAWPQLDRTLPGIGRGNVSRGEGLDGPRATLSLMTKRRFGRFKTDIPGVIQQLSRQAAARA